MNLTKSILFLLFTLLLSGLSFAQTTVSGKVVDKKGKAFPDIILTIISPTDTIQRVTDTEGVFSFKTAANSVRIIVQDEQVLKEVTVQIPSSESYQLDNIKVDVEYIPTVVINQTTTDNGLERLELIDFAKQTNNKVESYLVLTTAASSRNELTSNYNVRGGSYDENLVYVNGFLVNRPFLTRSGQQEGLSFINSALVSELYFSAGGFQSIYGDKLSSVLDIKYKDPKAFHASALAGLMGVEAHVEDALGKADRFRYLLGARYRANGYLLNSLPTKGNYNPVFWDAQLLTVYDVSDRLKWSVLAHTSSNRYQFEPETQQTDFGTSSEAYAFNIYFDGQENTRFLTTTIGTSLGYESFDQRFQATTYFTAFNSNEGENFDIQGQYYINELETDPSQEEFGDSIAVLGVGTFLNHARNRLVASIYSAYHDGSYTLKTFKQTNYHSQHQLKYGFGAQFDNFTDELSEWRMIDSAGYSVPQGTSTEVELFETIKGKLNLQNQRYHAYVQQHSEWRKEKKNIPVRYTKLIKDRKGIVTDTLVIDSIIPSSQSRLQFDLGVRGLYTSYNDEGMITPRASLTFIPIRFVYHNGQFVRRLVKLKLAAGFYYQPPFYREFRTFTGGLNPTVQSQKSFHLVAGTEYNFFMWGRKSPFKVSAEGYYKYLWDINPYEIENVRIRYYADNIATGYATGLDMNLHGEFVPGIQSFFKVGLLSTKEDIKGDYYYKYFNVDGVQVTPGLTTDSIADSLRVEPGGIRRPTDQHLTIGVLFQDQMPGLERFGVQVGINYGSRLPYGPPDYTRYKDTLTMKSYFRVDLGLSVDLLYKKHQKQDKWYSKMQEAMVFVEVFNLLGVNNVLSKQWIQDVSGKYYSIPNYLTQRRFNVKLLIRI
ncbi:MAG: hypothetical protein IT221_13715 [Fluviicola sp.]|nr:hypothetical protein [Fluviicola sp.]